MDFDCLQKSCLFLYFMAYQFSDIQKKENASKIKCLHYTLCLAQEKAYSCILQ